MALVETPEERRERNRRNKANYDARCAAGIQPRTYRKQEDNRKPGAVDAEYSCELCYYARKTGCKLGCKPNDCRIIGTTPQEPPADAQAASA